MKNLYFTFALVLIGSTLAHGSELILRVNRNGQHIVSASNQTQTNNYNTYQFYNLIGGNTQVKVVDKYNGQVIFKNNLQIPDGYQVIAELDAYGNMTITGNNPIVTNNNGGWTGTGGNVGTINYGNTGNGNYGHGNHCGTTYPNYPNGGNGGYYPAPNTNAVYFSQFVGSLKAESFDSNRLQNAKVYASKTNLTASQIKEIAATFTFDTNRLDWAKAAYSACSDKGNYFLLRDTFTFSSNYSALQDYISIQ
ncbi:DUF4476 domain-containing protein [Fluviicola sp.]|uniref:DUF4476 domain-containing protein n=1 Tax=Fluviicola sp. TaxID=1917219 RepID=UPI00262B7567|nr:DUF4476 domain-containing protein [Fluviicola sp.]